MSQRPLSAAEFRDWFATFGRVHTAAALLVVAVVCLAVPLVFRPGPLFQLALVGTLALSLGLPHIVLDQYSAYIALRPRMGALWPLGFLVGYCGCAIVVVLTWIHAPAAAAACVALLAVVHYGVDDLGDRGFMRILEFVARGFAPLALATLFNPQSVAAFVGWMILDNEAGDAFVHGVALPGALAWQGVWAIVVARQLQLATKGAPWRPALIAAEMSMQVLAFATLPPLVALALFATLLHAPRHIVDFARRNPWLGDPGRALTRVLRAAVIPTALGVAAITAAAYWAIGADATDAQLLRMFVWIATAFSVPHALFTYAALRRAGGVRETAPPEAETVSR